MVSLGAQLASIGVIAIILLIADRYIRLQGVMNYSTPSLESFQMPTKFNRGYRVCGVDMESCPEGTKCGNGICIETDPSPLEEKVPLMVLPARRH